ncbi:MAG TPA: hypothetical protein VKE74_26665 [Gemmataceae bacterium]|nr:hypothetical protein [Gemmataceae bacterium]
MATTPPPPTPPPGTSNRTSGLGAPSRQKEIKLVSHSPIFYWWPIWVLGYVFAIITMMEGNRLAIVPQDTKIEQHESEGKVSGYTLEVKGTTHSLERAAKEGRFIPRMSHKAWLGPVYCVVLLLTILITNIPLRGLWSFLVLLILVVVVLGISLIPGGWDDLLAAFGNLHIYINMAGYLFMATAVLVLWVVSVFIFDQRTYMIVTPGQIRVCEHIGASIRNFDTTGLSFEKQRDDLFRHWILGFFSGDLIVRTHGAEQETIRLPNVLWIGWRLEEVQEILREKAVVTSS